MKAADDGDPYHAAPIMSGLLLSYGADTTAQHGATRRKVLEFCESTFPNGLERHRRAAVLLRLWSGHP